MEKIKSEKVKNLILYLEQHGKCDNYSEVAEATGMSRRYLKMVLRKYNDMGVIHWNGRVFWLNKKRIKISRFSSEIVKQLVMPVTAGMFTNLMIAFTFGLEAMLFIMGGLIVFLPQIIYTLWKIALTKEVIEVYIK